MVDFFNLNYVTECYYAQIYTAFKQSYSLFLYDEYFTPFDALASANPLCGDLIYSLKSLPRGSEIVPEVEANFSLQINPADGQISIYVEPAIRANRGQYVFAIESCIEAGSGETYSLTCIDSQPFVVTIDDPCFTT